MSWKKIASADKKRITEDWSLLFPSLGVYKPMHLLNRVGPLLVGILLEVKSGSDSYTPTFHVHNLCKPFPVVTLGLETTVNRQYIHLEWHERKHTEIASQINKMALIPFEGDLALDAVLKGYKVYIEKRINPYLPQTYEDMILVSAWCGNSIQVQKGIELAESHMKQWPEQILTRIGGLEAWLKSVDEKAKDRENLIATSNQQSIELKVDQLPMRKILC
jgi:hypothetical protein